MILVTIDTNILPVDDLLTKSQGKDIDYKIVTVTERELENTDIKVDLLSVKEMGVYGEAKYGQARYSSKHMSLPEPFVINETLLNKGIICSEGDVDLLESLLNVISNKTFPAKGNRQNITSGQRRQLRDAIILMTHIKDHRDVFLTNDIKGFIGEDGEKRNLLESLFSIRIRTRSEFESQFLCE